MQTKTNVLFDVGILEHGCNLSVARSGIYFVAYNILLELLKRDDINLNFYCEHNEMPKLVEAIDKNLTFIDIKNFKLSTMDRIVIYFEKLKYLNKKKKGNKILRVFIKTLLNLSKTVLKLKLKLGFNKDYKKTYENIDIFISPYNEIPASIRNIAHIKKSIILYDTIPLLFPTNYPDLKKKNYWYNKLINSINEKDYYFAISKHTKNDFIKYVPNINPEHITVIPLSTAQPYNIVEDRLQIDNVKEKYNIPKDKKYIFSLCTIEPRKNHIFAIKNFIEFIKRNNIDDFIFVMGGGHWEHFIAKLNEAIDNLDDYKDKILKIGYVDDEDMPALYSGAEMFVFPSIYEGFGIPVLEAMYCGCPVITSNVTSMPEVIGDCGIQIDPTNNEDLIKAFEKMYFDKEFRLTCRNKGLQRALKFNWQNTADIIIKTMKGIDSDIKSTLITTEPEVVNNENKRLEKVL